MHGGNVSEGASRRASVTVEVVPPDYLNKSSRGRLPLFTNRQEEEFSETRIRDPAWPRSFRLRIG